MTPSKGRITEDLFTNFNQKILDKDVSVCITDIHEESEEVTVCHEGQRVTIDQKYLYDLV